MTAGYAEPRGLDTAACRRSRSAGGVVVAVVAGGVAGLYPALRAARLSPTEALRANLKRCSDPDLALQRVQS